MLKALPRLKKKLLWRRFPLKALPRLKKKLKVMEAKENHHHHHTKFQGRRSRKG